MKRGFIFGKFYPFHKGHQAMIDFALTQGDQITVLVCAEKYETIRGNTRAQWIRDTYKDEPKIHVEVFNYSESDYPSTSEADLDISRKWSQVFESRFPDADFFVSSEEYGDYVQSFTGAKHIMFDRERSTVNISASKIRSDIRGNWSFLPEAVQKYYQIKIVIGGTESTGKTTMIEKLHEIYPDSIVVGEVGRDVVDSSKTVEMYQLGEILLEHNNLIHTASLYHPIVFIDTDYNTTESYAYFKFDHILHVPKWIHEQSRANLYLYLSKDVPFVQDGTRFDLKDRNSLDISHRFILDKNNITYTEIWSDDYDQRLEQAKTEIENLIDSKL